MHRTRVRVTAGVFWFIAVAIGWELAWSLTGVPRIVGPFLGAAFGIAIALDPLRVIWPAAPSVTTAPSDAAFGVKPLAGGRVVAPGDAAPERTAAAEATQTAPID